jgi:hypothetical protein
LAHVKLYLDIYQVIEVTVKSGDGARDDANQSIWQERDMRNHRRGSVVDGHADLHRELGPNRGGAINPTIKVTDLASAGIREARPRASMFSPTTTPE